MSDNLPATQGNLVSDLAQALPGAAGTGAPGLARLAANSAVRAITWGPRAAIDTARDIGKQVAAGESISGIIDQRVEQARSTAWRALGMRPSTQEGVIKRGGGTSYKDLRRAGDELLRRSYNPAYQPRNEHPSFARILEELTPDEARILRFLAVSGSQPSIDIRSKTPFGVGSERLLGGYNMIADMAGCTWPDHSNQYLANLNRLGLVRFSEEPLEDIRRYSLIEAQPLPTEVMEKNGGLSKCKTIFRSIYLSMFGKQFTEVCFTLEGYEAGGWNKDARGDKVFYTKRWLKKQEALKGSEDK